MAPKEPAATAVAAGFVAVEDLLGVSGAVCDHDPAGADPTGVRFTLGGGVYTSGVSGGAGAAALGSAAGLG